MLYFKSPPKISTIISQLTQYHQLWLDTEIADWQTSQRRLSLIQVARNLRDKTGEKAIILDVLDQPDLIEQFIAAIMINPNIEKIFHNGAFDLRYLGGKEKAKNITCTLKLARKISKETLGTSNLKLKTLAQELCHFSDVDTETGTSNWTRRPLKEKQLHYAAMDVVYLRTVHQSLLNYLTPTIAKNDLKKSTAIGDNKTMKSISVTQIRLAFECPRLFYLNYHHGGKTLFIPPGTIKGVGSLFHHQAEVLSKFLQTEPEIKKLFALSSQQLGEDEISVTLQKLFYKKHFFPYLQEKINQNQNSTSALTQVWQGLANLIQQWTKILIKNRAYCPPEKLIETTFIGQEETSTYQFTLPNGRAQKVVGKFDSLIYDYVLGRPCIVEYKTYQPVDPASQLSQVGLYSNLIWQQEQKNIDGAIYCVLPEFKEYFYSWRDLRQVHQLIPHKLQQINEWITWKPGESNPPPATTSPHLCKICPQQEKCQTFFIESPGE